MAPEFIQEDETAGKSEVDSLKISIGDIDIYAGSDTSEELFTCILEKMTKWFMTIITQTDKRPVFHMRTRFSISGIRKSICHVQNAYVSERFTP